MVTEWKHRVLVLCVNKEAGNNLALLAESFQDDQLGTEQTFTDQLRTSPQAWVAVIPARDEFTAVIDALNENASIDDPRLAYIRERGMTASLWGQAKQIIIAEHYQYWKEDGSQVEEINLEEWVNGLGYTLVRETP